MRNKLGIDSRTQAASPANLPVVIPHRSTELTRSALKFAATLAMDLNVRLRLVDVHVVPYGISLDAPSVDPKHLTRKIRQLAQESDLPISAEVIYARDWEQGFKRALAPGSVVLMAMKRSWWPTKDKRLAARLRKLGHQVMWVDCA
ncbi:MAG TPA: hypothetical protein VGK48_25450 [Terriglobia bacterium]|jgi:hypothetical protein